MDVYGRGAAPHPEGYRSLDRPAGVAVVSVCIAAAFAVMEMVVAGMLFARVDVLVDPNATLEEFEHVVSLAETVDQVVVLRAAVLLAAGIGFIWWFRRAYHNLEPLRAATYMRRRPSSTIWGWFVPILNLFRPRQIVEDLREGSAPASTDAFPAAIANLWWGSFLLSGFLARVGLGWEVEAVETPSEAVHAMRSAMGWYLASDVFEIVAAVIVVIIVRRITAAQLDRALDVGRMLAGFTDEAS